MSNHITVVAAVSGIHFYNVFYAGVRSFGIWYVSLVTNTQEAARKKNCFVIDEFKTKCPHLCNQDSVNFVENEQARELEFMTWELEVRLRCPLIRKLMFSSGRIIQLKLTHEGVIQDVMDAAPCGGIEIQGAYAHCCSRLVPPSVQQCSVQSRSDAVDAITKDMWFKEFDGWSLEKLDIFIKASIGVYQFSSEDAPDDREKKRIKSDFLTIDDVFSTIDCKLSISGLQVSVRIPKTTFDVLWVNSDSEWNCGLMTLIFLLYKKCFNDFRGLKPILAYVFPRGTQMGSKFSPYFSSFPLVPLKFGHPSKLSTENIGPPFDARIMLDTECGLSKSPSANFIVLLQNIHKVAHCSIESSVCNQWPMWHTEINHAFCINDDAVSRIVTNHCILSINITGALCHLLDIKTQYCLETPSQILQNILDYGDSYARGLVISYYNILICAILNHFNKNGFSWVAIDHGLIHMVTSQLSEEETEVIYRNINN